MSAAADVATAGAAPRKGKKKLLIIIVAAVMLLALAGGAAMMLMNKKAQDTEESIDEDGAPVGAEVDQAHLIVSLLNSADNVHGRVGVRLLPLQHPQFDQVAAVVLKSARAPAYLMLPKPDNAADVQRAADAIDALGGVAIPLHALIETHGALHDVFAIAAHPRIESLSFGLMDFVSAHRGAIPHSAMAARACGASTRRRSARSSKPSRRRWPSSTRRSRSSSPHRPRSGHPSATRTRCTTAPATVISGR